MALYEDIAIFKEDLFNTSDTNRGSIFRGILFFTLFASTAWNGWSLFREMRSETWTRPIVQASQEFADETFVEQKQSMKIMRSLRNHSSRYASVGDRYIFNGLPDPTGVMQGTPLPERIELTESEKGLLALYDSVNPESFMSVSAIMHGPGHNSAIVHVRSGGPEKVVRVETGTRIDLPSIGSPAEIVSVNEESILVKIKNGEWTIPILNIEAQKARDKARKVAKNALDAKVKEAQTRSVDPNATPEDRINAHNEGVSLLRRRLYQQSSGRFGSIDGNPNH